MMTRSWHGDEVAARMHRAAGRAVVAIGVNVATDTKRLSHRISGTLVRSTHSAPARYDGGDDEARARAADLPNVMEASYRGDEAAVEVGSWLPYACVEWIGRGHPGITQGLEMTRGERTHRIVLQAVREEGL